MSYEIRNTPPNQRQTTLSPLLAAKSIGANPNLCPFGCPDDDLDEHGYCFHLIGFTNDKKRIELMKRLPNGYTAVQVPYTVKRLGPKHVKRIYQYDRVLPTDELRQISVSWRVYRNIERPVEFFQEDIQVPDEDLDEDAEELVETE